MAPALQQCFTMLPRFPHSPRSARSVAVALCTGLLAASTATVAHTAASSQPPGALACYQAALERTAMPEYRARRLCEGADTVAPVDCFEGSQRRTDLSSVQGVELCQCARTLRPVQCCTTAEEETDLTSAQLLRMCSARALNDVVLPHCVPPSQHAASAS